MILGDGHLDKYGQLNLLHSDKQLEYLKWKVKLLKKHGIKVSPIKKKINNKKYIAYYASTKVYNFSKLYRKILYIPKKTFPLKQLEKLTPLHIAIWYMDDGSLQTLRNKDGYVRGNTLSLNTNISKEENQVIIDLFKRKWNINFKQRKKGKYYILECHTKEARKFIKLIYNFVYRVPCMRYKLNVKPLTLKSLTNHCRYKRTEKESMRKSA